ncbi:MAG: NifU family protein [Rickettsiales bacterium]
MQKLKYINLSNNLAEIFVYYKDFFSVNEVIYESHQDCNNSILIKCLIDSKINAIGKWINKIKVYQNSLTITFNRNLESFEQTIAEHEISEIIHKHFQSGLGLFDYAQDNKLSNDLINNYNENLNTNQDNKLSNDLINNYNTKINIHNKNSNSNLEIKETFSVLNIEKTPNQFAFKFNISRDINGNNVYYTSIEEAINSKLARNIFSVPIVKAVFFGQDFITITFADYLISEEINQKLISIIEQFNEIFEFNSVVTNSDNLTEIEKEIVYVLDTYIKDAVAQDGGSIIYKSYSDGIVTVELRGACSGCPSSTITLKNGIENTLKFYIPEIKEVIAY